MSSFKQVCNTFIVFCPVIYIVSLIICIYTAYIKDYLIPLINGHDYGSDLYPFHFTSNKEGSRSKGIFLAVFSGYHLVILLIAIARTVFIDPGYFPKISDLEFGIVKKQIHYHSKLDRDSINSGEDKSTTGGRTTDYSNHTKIVSLIENEMLDGPVNNREYMLFRNQINSFIEDKSARGDKYDDQEYFQDRNSPGLAFNEMRDPAEIFLRTEEQRRFNPEDVFENLKEHDLYNSILCNTCLRIKVERSHHCRQCGRCVLKMDHHCPWLATCIGFRNYKYFCLVHLYGVISTFTVFVTFWEAVAATFTQNEIPIMKSWFILYCYFANIGLMSFLIWLLYCNVKLVFTGQTVIEQSDRERFPNGKVINNYDLGYYRNFTNVFGKNPLVWFFPIFPNYTGDGFAFEKAQRSFM